MANKIKRGNHSWAAVWDFLLEFQELRCWKADLNKMETAISKLKYVSDVCIYHMCWVKFDFETDSIAVADKRLSERKDMIIRILKRYSKNAIRQGQG